MPGRHVNRVFIVLAVLLAFSTRMAAASFTWNGSVDGSWSNPANWSPNGTPADGDSILFVTPGVSGLSVVDDIPGPLKLVEIDIEDSYAISGTGVLDPGTIHYITNAALTPSLSMPLALSGTLTIFPGSGTVQLQSAISGPGSLVINSQGTVRFTGSATNTFTGGTSVTAGAIVTLERTGGAISIPGPLAISLDQFDIAAVRVITAPAIANSAVVTLTQGGTFDLSTVTSGHDQSTDTETIGALVGFGGVALGTSNLGLAGPTSPATFTGQISGTGGIRKTGSGIQVLSGGPNTYTGVTQLSGGELHLLSSQPTTNVSVTGGTLHVSGGTVGAIAFSGGTASALFPGGESTPASYQGSCGDLTFVPATTYQVHLTGSGPGAYASMHVTGAVTLANAALRVQEDAFAPTSGTTFTIIDNDGADAINGHFDGLAEGATVTSVGGLTYTISYVGGDGNDVVLTSTNPGSGTTAGTTTSTGTGGTTTGTGTATSTGTGTGGTGTTTGSSSGGSSSSHHCGFGGGGAALGILLLALRRRR